MERLSRFLREYRLFSFALVAALVGLALQLIGQHTAVHWLLGVAAIGELLPILADMWRDFRAGKYGIDILAATAIGASVALNQSWAAIVIVLMLTGGEALENYAEHRAHSELRALLEHAPLQAHVLRKGKLVDVPVNELHVGDKIVIKPGEVVPVDSVILEGTASFDEASLTGESLPQTKQVKDTVLSGSINIDGAVTAKVLASAENSQYQQIIKLVRSAAARQAPFVRLADRYSLPFTFAAFAIAATVWVLTGHAIRFLEVIVVATPCPLLLAAPIALISGMSRASRYGIIVKTGSALEKLAEARTIAFDKTGTLTRGELSVDGVRAFAPFQESDVLSIAASLEQSSNHVLAQAIVSGAQGRGVKFAKAKHVQEIAGRGVQATVKGHPVLVGRLSLLQEQRVKLPSKFAADTIQQTAAYVAINGQLAGVITMRDELRPESKATLRLLHRLGFKEIMMVTGDNKATAKQIAKQLGIDHVHAEALPADKVHVLDEVTDRPLVFVGDGVNDAPILTAADVGIALGARGSTAASESADIVIMLDDLGRVATARSIANRTFRIATQSIVVGIVLSLLLMLVFATGKFSPLDGAVIQEVVDVVVIFNALRAHTGKLATVK
jgi:heavy metal translocating P-type ATPase